MLFYHSQNGCIQQSLQILLNFGFDSLSVHSCSCHNIYICTPEVSWDVSLHCTSRIWVGWICAESQPNLDKNNTEKAHKLFPATHTLHCKHLNTIIPQNVWLFSLNTNCLFSKCLVSFLWHWQHLWLHQLITLPRSPMAPESTPTTDAQIRLAFASQYRSSVRPFVWIKCPDSAS